MSHYGRALQSKVTAGDQKGNSNLSRSCRSRRRSNRDGMLGGARPDEIRWRGETKDPPECVSVRQSSRRRQYFYRAGKNILGDGFSSVESEWRSKRSSFTTSNMFKADHTPCHGSRFWLVCWRYERDNPEGIKSSSLGIRFTTRKKK